MPLETTVIGAFPKPLYLSVPDWSSKSGADCSSTTKAYTKLIQSQAEADKSKFEEDIIRATEEVIQIQSSCGVDVVTDGEVRRENYIHYLCRFIDGIDFENLTDTPCRNGAYFCELPTVRGKVSWQGGLDVVAEWRKAQEVSTVPVKYTLPGPMTIIGTLHNAHYEKEEALGADLAEILNNLARALAKAGCKSIQIDEPVFARLPEKALDWGIKLLDRCFDGVDGSCLKVVHICCGYPEFLDQPQGDYPKADPSSYFKLAPRLEECCVDAVSIEDAHRHNDLALLAHFKKTKVILGVVNVASSRIETQEEIEARLQQALEYIDPANLIVAPDCGLVLLPVPVLREKLTNMCAAAKCCGHKRARLI